MEVSIELTMSPLQDDFEQHIINFIKVLRASSFKVMENPLSTQIYGPYSSLMPFLVDAIEESLSEQDAVLIYMKLVKSNRADYKPHF
ncbi:thiamine-binding protein [Nonlabens antarcticus]|uniref:thiamine-binding protein n=1 Tax=Nonlabens antarcticus TaxID=392714 RepID=UPI0018915655|nr:thiamine-binding protein [Nonlabens antarcticus]